MEQGADEDRRRTGVLRGAYGARVTECVYETTSTELTERGKGATADLRRFDFDKFVAWSRT
ncbi:MAG: hypothetical protein WBN70_13015 [Polyangiales bacterium]